MRLPDLVRASYALAQQGRKAALPYPLSFFGGDGWQCYVHHPASALVVALLMRASLRYALGADTRIALTLGPVRRVRGANVGESGGAAFVRSGRELKTMKRGQRFDFSVDLDADAPLGGYALLGQDALEEALTMTAQLTDYVAADWTQAQAQAVSLRLVHPGAVITQLAERWKPKPITKQGLSRHLKAAGWNVLEAALQSYRLQATLTADLCEQVYGSTRVA